MIKITSSSNPTFRKAMRLHESRGRKQQGRIIVFGAKEIVRAITSGVQIDQVFASQNRSAETDAIFASLDIADADRFELDDDLLAKLSFGQRVDEIVLIAHRPETNLQSWSPKSDSENPLIVVLESIEKPGNVGAVFRSAVAAGVDAIVLANPLTDVFHPNAIRSSLGSVFSIDVYTGTSDEVKEVLVKNQIAIFAARVESSTIYTEVKLNQATAIAVGNEHNGLSDVWRGSGVEGVWIPMREKIDSLNVAMSATLLAYEANRQRNSALTN